MFFIGEKSWYNAYIKSKETDWGACRLPSVGGRTEFIKEDVMEESVNVKRFVQRLKRGAVKKSLVASLVVALFALAVFAGVGWYFAFKAVWAYAVAFVVVVLAAFPLFYFCKYKKTEREVASAVDELGLEERMITMESLKGEDSYIARRQREDTVSALAKVNEKRFSLVLSTALLVCLAIALPLGAGLTTVSALAAEGVLPFGNEVAAGVPQRYTLKYSASEGGSLSGSTAQRVAQGETGAYVVATPDEGYIFLRWNDGYKNNVRCDVAEDKDVIVTAIFVNLEDYIADMDVYDPDKKGNQPGDGNKSGSEKSNDDAPPSDPKGGQDKGPSDGAGGGAEDESGYIIDGKTFYGGKVLDDAQKNAVDRVNGGSDYTDKDKGLINGYYNSIGR